MSTKGFLTLLGGVLGLGIIIGGAFIGGFAVGESRGAEASQTAAAAPIPPSQAASESDAAGGTDFASIREQIQSGEVSQEQLDQIRQQFQGQGGPGGGFGGGGGGFGGQGFGGRAGLSGSIEEVDGNTLTVSTSQGPLYVTVSDDTVIQMTSEVTLAELLEGARVTVTGERGEDGNLNASSVFVLPEGSGEFGGGFSGGGSRGFP